MDNIPRPSKAVSLQPKFGYSLLLFLLTSGHYGLMYAANILLAHALMVKAFNNYNVAISVVTMLSTFATLGLEKYALRALPLFRERKAWQAYRGYRRFSITTILVTSIALIPLAATGLSLIDAYTLHDLELQSAVTLYACFLPLIALALFFVEMLAAQGAFLISVLVYRLFLPGLYLAFIAVPIGFAHQISDEMALIILGVSWGLALALLSIISWRLTPIPAKSGAGEFRRRKWLSRSLPLVINSLMMSVMTSGGVVIMELLYPTAFDVSLFAVSAQTGGFVSLVGTSTNRYFLPMIVVLNEQRDTLKLAKLMQKKSIIIGSLVLSLLALIFGFGDALLGLFGDRFREGYATLVIIASGAAFSALYADIPYFLQFLGMQRLVLAATFTAVLSMGVIAVVLGPELHSVGVAIAYALPVAVLFTGLKFVAEIQLKRLTKL